jgi:DNA-binding GntR family transcriptional regulator
VNQFVLKTETRRQQVAQFLREEILVGHRKAGSPLREVELSKELGVSRGPIREAIRELEKEGLVEVRPYAGTTVARISLEDLVEVYQIRSALEKKAFELVWPKRDEAFRAEFTRRHEFLLEAIAEARGPAIVDAEQYFHSLPYELFRNGLVLNFWKQLAQRMRLCFLLHSEVFALSESYSEAHVGFLEAALGDDLSAMNAEIDTHLSKGEGLLRAAFNASESSET